MIFRFLPRSAAYFINNVCSCGSNPQLQIVLGQINIIDENDNAPTVKILTDDVTFLANHDVIVDVNEEMAVGATVFSVSAFDPDQGLNGDVTYDLEDLSHHGLLALNAGKLGEFDAVL